MAVDLYENGYGKWKLVKRTHLTDKDKENIAYVEVVDNGGWTEACFHLKNTKYVKLVSLDPCISIDFKPGMELDVNSIEFRHYSDGETEAVRLYGEFSKIHTKTPTTRTSVEMQRDKCREIDAQILDLFHRKTALLQKKTDMENGQIRARKRVKNDLKTSNIIVAVSIAVVVAIFIIIKF